MIWQCPLCAAPLTLGKDTWHCTNRHNFDCAREGYVNLLPVYRKRRKDPGDSSEMLHARRRFLHAGYYRPLVDSIAALLPYKPGRRLLDIGCGEGYYLRELESAGWHGHALSGIDISKSGVRMAAKRDSGAQFVVASNVNLPIAAGSVDNLLKIFAPAPDHEMERVIKTGGHLVDVSPGPDHLWTLKQHLYREPRKHTAPKIIEKLSPEVDLRTCFQFELKGKQAISDFLAMTPFAWKGNREARQKLEERTSLTLEADFVIRRFIKHK
ncbi:methyltransferase domain-containing protein [Microbulbifer sp. OS29]|uniref:Methyltransferase domain-containing protein n=1 Tax=Microbulbifer okhotskensis TaxID=2926617 RepID=A0A9X2EMD5_9GAMM|nr:methyltransferase domain-containing protein [Microbulbifer okhotskensis]MCO1333740.1 methyltransferase domain-containing protein [Microbulbifer okhotskensis]